MTRRDRRSSGRRSRRLIWLATSVVALIAGATASGLLRGPGATSGAGAYASPADASSGSVLSYDATSDRETYPYPPLPALGGAGYRFADPTFRSKMLRVTDATTRPDTPGRMWSSPSSSETTAWNTNGTKFYVVGGGGETIPYTFDAVTMTASRMGDPRSASGGLVLDLSEPSFSFADPDLIYAAIGTAMTSYRFSTATRQVVHDEQTCLPGVVARSGRGISVTKDDHRLLDYVGGTVQDAETYVYVFDHALGCRWLNTQTGQVGGRWGATGPYIGDRGWRIHNARISKNGKWVRITSGGGDGGRAGVYFWQVESLNLVACNASGPPYCGGHLVTGFDHVINQRQLGDGMEFAIRRMGVVSSAAALITPLLAPPQYENDTHLSWNNVQPDEQQPVCLSAYRVDNRVQRPWDGEIICIDTRRPSLTGRGPSSHASTVWRFAHHRSRYRSFWDSPRANVSQDGRLVLFTSNWEQTVGPDRQDAFIVQLAPSNSTRPATSAKTSAR